MEIISSVLWTAEDRAIFERKRKVPNRTDELLGDKCDSLRMLKLASVKADHATLAFGGLSPSELSDTSALRCKHSFVMEDNDCQDCIAEVTGRERSDKTPFADVPLVPLRRDRKCEVGLLPGNAPEGHELLPEFICDVHTRFGPWAWLCPACTAAFGCGFGLGKGQRFVNDGSLRKVEG